MSDLHQPGELARFEPGVLTVVTQDAYTNENALCDPCKHKTISCVCRVVLLACVLVGCSSPQRAGTVSVTGRSDAGTRAGATNDAGAPIDAAYAMADWAVVPVGAPWLGHAAPTRP